jgi:hypothetical protein
MLSNAPSKLSAFIIISVTLVCLVVFTFSVPSVQAAEICPNEVFRAGPSAKLPDCRAYELVTPANTNGLEPTMSNYIGTLSNGVFNMPLINEAGNDVLFQTVGGALSGMPGTGYINRYEAKRRPDGWSTELRGIPGDLAVSNDPAGMSPDHKFLFTEAFNLLGLWAPWKQTIKATFLGTPSGFEPVGRGSLGDDPGAQAFFLSNNGTHIVFTSKQQLEPNAPPPTPPTTTQALYDRSYGGETHVVSLLPDGSTPTNNARFVAASKDGSEILFELGADSGDLGGGVNQDPLYLHRNNTTIQIPVPAEHTFAGLMGGHVFFADSFSDFKDIIQRPGDLYSYDIATGTTAEITHNTEDSSFVDVSEDGSHVFFVSLSALTGSEQNERGQSAIPPAKGSGTLSHAKGQATLKAAAGGGKVTKGSTVVTNVVTKEGAFEVGMEISGEVNGEGILKETTITAVGAETLTLSKPAALTRTSKLKAGSKVATGVTTSEGPFQVGMEITKGSFPEGTTITAVGAETLTLSRGATGSGVGAELEAGSKVISGLSTSEGQFLAGMLISGTGIPAGTTIESVGAGTLKLSKPVTTSGVQTLTGGAPNLYVWSQSDESTKFIATVDAEDVTLVTHNQTANLASWVRAIGARLSDSFGRATDHARSTPDGSVFAFESTAPVTGFDNTEADPADCGESDREKVPIAGQPCDEVYRYETATGELTCVSCGAGGGPATGNARLQSVQATLGTVTPLLSYNPVESLTEDGNTLFFESTESLLPRDVNGTKDVYEWKKGKGLSLISTGQSSGESALWAVTPSGSDAVFATRETLLPQDENGSSIRVYDARENGGFPPPESTVTEPCSGDACQGTPSAAPPAPETASGSLQAEGGNVPKKLSCTKGKKRVVRRGKESCVKKPQHRRRHHHKRGV